MPVITTKDQTKSIFAAMRRLTEQEVLIGIPDENAARAEEEAADKKAAGEPITNAGLGYVNEFGRPEDNIPARPFLVPGVESAKDRVAKVLGAAARKTLEGDPDAAAAGLTKAGLIAETAVKSKIDEGPFAPLAPATLAERKRRGRTGEKPLIDTAQMQRSVTHVVRPKDDPKTKGTR